MCYFRLIQQQKSLSLSLVGLNDAFNTIRLYKRQGCVSTEALSENHKTKYATLFRLLTQTIEAPQKRNRNVKSDKHTERKSGKER